MNQFDIDTLADAIEAWPPAPFGAVEQDKAQPAPRPSIWLQLGLGLVAGIFFVPTVWLCLVLLPFRRSDTSTAPQIFVGVAFFAAFAGSALVWRHYRAFAVTFAVVSAVSACFTWFVSVIGNMSMAY